MTTPVRSAGSSSVHTETGTGSTAHTNATSLPGMEATNANNARRIRSGIALSGSHAFCQDHAMARSDI